MTAGGRSVAGAMLELLGQHGTRQVFGIPGVHNLPFWDVDAAVAPTIVGVRHEQTAGYAADASYRTSGTPSAALVTSGPGTANVVTAFGEAYVSGSPVIVLASEVAMSHRAAGGPRGLLHEMHDQGAMFEAFGATARSARTRQEAVASTVLALRDAWGPPARGSYVGVPTDVLSEEWTASVPHLPRLPAPGADPHDVGVLAELIGASERVVLWLGGGVVAAGAEAAARALAHRLGSPVLTSYAGRGLLAGDPLLVDAPVHEPEVAAVLAEADLLVVLGSSFDGMNTKNWRIPLPPRRAVVTLGEIVRRTVDFDVCIDADVALTLAALEETLDEDGTPARPPWTDVRRIRAQVLSRLAADPLTSVAVEWVEQVARGWPDAGAVVCDMAVGGYWVGGYTSQPRPRRLVHAIGWGTLGFALPAAIGPAAGGIATLAVCGDGGPMFALGELATMAQESLPVTVLIVDDAGYGMLRYDQEVAGLRERGVDLLTPDWSALAGSFGITTQTVEHVGEVGAALARAHEANLRGEPRVVVWRHRLYPPRTQSPRWSED